MFLFFFPIVIEIPNVNLVQIGLKNIGTVRRNDVINNFPVLFVIDFNVKSVKLKQHYGLFIGFALTYVSSMLMQNLKLKFLRQIHKFRKGKGFLGHGL